MNTGNFKEDFDFDEYRWFLWETCIWFLLVFICMFCLRHLWFLLLIVNVI